MEALKSSHFARVKWVHSLADVGGSSEGPLRELCMKLRLELIQIQ